MYVHSSVKDFQCLRGFDGTVFRISEDCCNGRHEIYLKCMKNLNRQATNVVHIGFSYHVNFVYT